MDIKRRNAQFLERMQQIARKSFSGDYRSYEIKYFTATGYDYARETADLSAGYQKDHDENLQEQGIKAL